MQYGLHMGIPVKSCNFKAIYACTDIKKDFSSLNEAKSTTKIPCYYLYEHQEGGSLGKI